MRIAVVTCAFMFASMLLPAAYKEGPLPGMTGGFGEPTCTTCHFDHPVNERSGSLRLAGLPRTYTPGRHYTITITLERPQLKLGGFELASRFARGAMAGQQAGALAPLDSRTQILQSPDGLLQYVQHNRTGNRAGQPGRLEWTIRWTAPPASGGPVVFHVAANAANDDDSPLGDYIYMTEATSK